MTAKRTPRWLLALPLLLSAERAGAAPGPVVPNFALLDQDGRAHEVLRTDARLLVVAFVCGAPAPAACASVDALVAARRRFRPKDVAFWMVSARLGESRAALAVEARALGADASFPLLHDEARLVARALGASRQGEVFVIERRHRHGVFHGSLGQPAALDTALGAALHHGNVPSTGAGDGAPLGLPAADAEAVSYARDVAPLIRRRCVPCHRAGDVAPFEFTGYRAVKGWGATIEEVLLTRRMPPWSADPHVGGPFAEDRSLSPAEIDLLWRFVEQGAPRGDGPDALESPAATPAEWSAGTPDYVVELPAVEHIPATGVIPYQNRVSTFVMPKDAWLSAAIAHPDNHAVVHHITIYAQYPAGFAPKGEDSYLSGWAPGMELGRFPPGTGKFVPKGTAFRFEVHYTPDGKPEDDRSRLGLFVVKGPAPRRLETRFAWDEDLLVPAGEPELLTHALYGFEHGAVLYDLIPHMHNRGAWVRYEALYPDGQRETLLSVPRYDFGWQTVYRLARPRHVPAGTWVLITAGYDNSPLNPANPDPKRAARWGEQTWDEMFVPQLDVVQDP